MTDEPEWVIETDPPEQLVDADGSPLNPRPPFGFQVP